MCRMTSRSARANRHTPLVSVLIPTLDEARELPHLLDHLAALHGHWETIVADGGSRDATRQHRRRRTRCGRASSSSTAAARRSSTPPRAVASGDVLLFLHADSRLPRDAYASLAEAWRTPTSRGGNFALRFDDGSGAFERVARRRLPPPAPPRPLLRRLVGLGHAARAFDALGGFREIPIMDDYDFVRRLERSRRDALPARPGDDVGAALAPGRHRAHGARLGSSIRRLYVAGVAARQRSPGCTGSCVSVAPMGRLIDAAARARDRDAPRAPRPDGRARRPLGRAARARQAAQPDARPADDRLRGHARRLSALQPRLHPVLPRQGGQPRAHRRRPHRARGRPPDGAAARAARARPARAAHRRRGDAARRRGPRPRAEGDAAPRPQADVDDARRLRLRRTSRRSRSTRRPAGRASPTSPSPATSTRSCSAAAACRHAAQRGRAAPLPPALLRHVRAPAARSTASRATSPTT